MARRALQWAAEGVWERSDEPPWKTADRKGNEYRATHSQRNREKRRAGISPRIKVAPRSIFVLETRPSCFGDFCFFGANPNGETRFLHEQSSVFFG